MIEFKRVLETTYMIDPMGNKISQNIEQRIDPLTANVASINTVLGEKAKAFLGSADIDMMVDLQEKTKPNCPFCTASEKGTRYTKDFAEEGQINRGSSIAMPNLFSKCSFDSVIIVNYKNHTLFPSKIDIEDFANTIFLAKTIINRARAYDNTLTHHILGMNFLNPGGSSVPHPHFQLHIRKVPYSGGLKLIELSKAFYDKYGKNYWEALCDQEKQMQERYLGQKNGVEFLASFAPSHQREIWGILNGKSSLADITENEALGFAEGISKVITYYESINNHPYTLAFFSAPDAKIEKFFSLQVRICSRPAFRSLYSNYDTWFAPKFVGDEVHTDAPENYAKEIKKVF